MRVGVAKVAVLRQTGAPFPEVVAKNGKTYVVAEPNEVFSVKIAIGDNAHYPGATHFRVTIDVDGKNVGMARILSSGGLQSTVFEGFLVEGGGGNFKYAQFKFAQPATSEDARNVTGDPDKLPVGKIKVIITPVIKTGSKHQDFVVKKDVQKAVIPNMCEGKKWFYAPSLAATAGASLEQAGSWDLNKYIKVGEPYEETLRYETAAILKLREVLNPANPEHKAILGNLAVDSASTSARKHDKDTKRKGEPRVKPAVAQATKPALLLDLTGEDTSRIKLENGRCMERDEFATCDLTGGVATAKWEVHKKARLIVD